MRRSAGPSSIARWLVPSAGAGTGRHPSFAARAPRRRLRPGRLIEENALLAARTLQPSTPPRRRIAACGCTTSPASDAEARERMKQAALREYLILDGLDHPGILKALEFKRARTRPGDGVPPRRGRGPPGPLPGAARQPAHSGPAPRPHPPTRRGAQVRSRPPHHPPRADAAEHPGDWGQHRQAAAPDLQLAIRQASGHGNRQPPTIRSATLHPNQIADGSQLVYVAPEALSDPRGRGETMDVFSLGAIAYHIFSGKAPALSLPERDQVVLDGDGFRIAAVLDGAAPELAELIHESTPAGRHDPHRIRGGFPEGARSIRRADHQARRRAGRSIRLKPSAARRWKAASW